METGQLSADTANGGRNVLKKVHQPTSKAAGKKPSLFVRIFHGSSSKSKNSLPDMDSAEMNPFKMSPPELSLKEVLSPKTTSVNDEEMDQGDRISALSDLALPSPLQYPHKGNLQPRYELTAHPDRPLAVSNSEAELSPLSHERNRREAMLRLIGEKDERDLANQNTRPMEMYGFTPRGASGGSGGSGYVPTNSQFFRTLWADSEQVEQVSGSNDGSLEDFGTEESMQDQLRCHQPEVEALPTTFTQQLDIQGFPPIEVIAYQMGGDFKEAERIVADRVAYLRSYYQGKYNYNSPPLVPGDIQDSFPYLPALNPSSEEERLLSCQRFTKLWLRRTPALLELVITLTRQFEPDYVTLSVFRHGQEIFLANNAFFLENKDAIVREESLSAHCMYDSNVLVVHDTKKDWRFKGNPFVGCYPNIRFFASTPLLSKDSKVIAVMSIFGKAPRMDEHFTIHNQGQQLAAIGRELMDDLNASLDDVDDGLTSRLQMRLSRHLLADSLPESRLTQLVFKRIPKRGSAIISCLVPRGLDIRKAPRLPVGEYTPPPTADSEMDPGPQRFHGFDQYPAEGSYFETSPDNGQYSDYAANYEMGPSSEIVRGLNRYSADAPNLGMGPSPERFPNKGQFSAGTSDDHNNNLPDRDTRGDQDYDLYERPNVHPTTLYAGQSSQVRLQENVNMPPPPVPTTESAASQRSTISTTNSTNTREKQHQHQGSTRPLPIKRRIPNASQAKVAEMCRDISTALMYDHVYVVEVAGIDSKLADGTPVTDIKGGVYAKSGEATLKSVSKEYLYETLHCDAIRSWKAAGDSFQGDNFTAGDVVFIHTDEDVSAALKCSSGFVLVALRTSTNKANKGLSRYQEVTKLNARVVALRKVLASSHHRARTEPNPSRYPANEATEVVVPPHAHAPSSSAPEDHYYNQHLR